MKWSGGEWTFVSPYLVNTFVCSQVLGCVLPLFNLGCSFQELRTASFPYISPKRPFEESKHYSLKSVLSGTSGAGDTMTDLFIASSSTSSHRFSQIPRWTHFFFPAVNVHIWQRSFGGMLVLFLDPGDSESYNHLAPT